MPGIRSILTTGLAIAISLCLINTQGCATNVNSTNPDTPYPERLRQGQEVIAGLSHIIPNEKTNTVEVLLKNMEGKWDLDKNEDWDFGAHKLTFVSDCYYFIIYLEIIELDGEIGFCKVSAYNRHFKTLQLMKEAVDALEANSGLKFNELPKRWGRYYQCSFEKISTLYFNAVSKKLGPILPLDIPPEIRPQYEYLISPFNNSDVTETGCGYIASVPEGKIAIDSLIESKRVDLVKNVLKGYNPGGRIWAAISLLRMEQQGLYLDIDTINTIEIIRELMVPITCCELSIELGLKGKDVIQKFINKKEPKKRSFLEQMLGI